MVTKPTIWPNGRFGVPQITPYTYRDGHTLLELIKSLRDHVVEQLHPSLQHAIDQLVEDVEAEYEKAHDRYVDGVQEFQRIHDAFMSDVNANLIALNDHAVTDIVSDDTSMLGQALRELFASHQELDNYRDTVDMKLNASEQTVNTTLQQYRQDTQTTLNEFQNTVGVQLSDFQNSVNQDVQNVRRDVADSQDRERKLSDQTDLVSTLAARSNLGHMEVRVTGTSDYPSLSIYRVYDGGSSGFFAETTLSGGDLGGNDEFQRIWETHIGYARNTSTVGQYSYERRATIGPKSNQEFALRFRPAKGSSSTFWFPMHNNIPTAYRASDPLFMTPNGRLRILEGDVKRATIEGHLDVIQHLYGRHPDTGNTNLIEMWITQRFTPDGVITITGRWKALQDLVFDSGYVMMFPGNPSYVDSVVTSIGNKYENSISKYGSSEYLDQESDQAISYAYITNGAHNFTSAVTYDNVHETLRRGTPKPDIPVFIEHRNSSIVKVYNQLFDGETLVKAGTTHRFGGRYIYAYSPQINEVIDL